MCDTSTSQRDSTASGTVDTSVPASFGAFIGQQQQQFVSSSSVQQQQSQQHTGIPVVESSRGHQGPTFVPPHVKLPLPAKFSGKHSQLVNFLFRCDQYITFTRLNDSSAVQLIVSLLEGDADTWWRMKVAEAGGLSAALSNITLDELKDELQEQFRDIDHEYHLRDSLFNIRQTTSVQEYTTRFRKLQTELGADRLPDAVAMHLYVDGLKPYTQEKVAGAYCDTLGDMILTAEKAEQALFRLRNRQRGGPQNPNNGSKGSSKNSGGNSGSRSVGNTGGFRGYNTYPRPFKSSDGSHPYKGPAPMDLGPLQGGKKDVECWHCGKKGHTRRDCYLLKKQGGGGQASSSGGKQQHLGSMMTGTQQPVVGASFSGGVDFTQQVQIGDQQLDMNNVLKLGIKAAQN